METLNRVFERLFSKSYKEWHKTEFCVAEKEYARAKKIYRRDPENRDKWKAAKHRYQRAMKILEIYEEFEIELS